MMTGLDHTPEADQITAAAHWLADNWHVAPRPLIRTIRTMFGLGFIEAVKAMAEARRVLDADKAVKHG